MTRKDWWLGILVIIFALLVHALVVVRANRHPGAARFWPLSGTEIARTETMIEK
jgi:hypothetical protein